MGRSAQWNWGDGFRRISRPSSGAPPRSSCPGMDGWISFRHRPNRWPSKPEALPSIRQGHDRIGHGVKPKAAVRYLCPWLEYLPHKYVRVRFLSKFPGFRQNVKSPKILWYLGESKMTLCEHTWTGKICIFPLSMDIMRTWT